MSILAISNFDDDVHGAWFERPSQAISEILPKIGIPKKGAQQNQSSMDLVLQNQLGGFLLVGWWMNGFVLTCSEHFHNTFN